MVVVGEDGPSLRHRHRVLSFKTVAGMGADIAPTADGHPSFGAAHADHQACIKHGSLSRSSMRSRLYGSR